MHRYLYPLLISTRSARNNFVMLLFILVGMEEYEAAFIIVMQVMAWGQQN